MYESQINSIVNKYSELRPERQLKSLKQSLLSIVNCDSYEYIQEIYVYGSFARGDFTYNSDIDLLILCSDNINKLNCMKIRDAAFIEDSTLPDVDLKFLKVGSSLDKHFMNNIRRDGVLLWKK